MRSPLRRPAALLALALLAVTAARADSGSLPLQRIVLGELGGWIALTVTIGGQEGRWLLDSGSSRNLVSPALARRLVLEPTGRVRAETPLGRVEGDEVALPSLRTGALERAGQQAMVIELQQVLGAAAQGVDGVLAVPWMEGVQAELDLRAWTARFSPGGAADCPERMASVALTRLRSLPVIELQVGQARERYVLDSGNPAGLIRVEAEAADAATPGLALPGGLRLTVLREVALGAQRRLDVPVTRFASAPLARALGGQVRGLAGTALLDGARWRLDLARGQLCVEAGRFATPGGFGLLPEREGEALVVRLVLPDSPAERAGLRAGDVVARWAGLPAARPLAELWQAVQGREALALTVGSPPREVTLQRAIFAPVAP